MSAWSPSGEALVTHSAINSNSPAVTRASQGPTLNGSLVEWLNKGLSSSTASDAYSSSTTSTSPPLKSAAYEGRSWVLPGPLIRGGLCIL
eukprot:1059168-Pyramimonas_sp.AAC.1